MFSRFSFVGPCFRKNFILLVEKSFFGASMIFPSTIVAWIRELSVCVVVSGTLWGSCGGRSFFCIAISSGECMYGLLLLLVIVIVIEHQYWHIIIHYSVIWLFEICISGLRVWICWIGHGFIRCPGLRNSEGMRHKETTKAIPKTLNRRPEGSPFCVFGVKSGECSRLGGLWAGDQHLAEIWL